MQPLRVVAAIGQITRLFSVAFLFPIPFAFIYDERDAFLFGFRVPWTAIMFLLCFILALMLSGAIHLGTRRIYRGDLKDKEAYLTVAAGWFVLTILAATPFWATGVMPHFYDALFEAMSGLTTTGASAYAGSAEDLPASISMWRAFLQWIGGIGIIVLFVAIISSLTQGGLNLFQAEASGHLQTRLKPKLVETARALWKIYGAVTGVMVVTFLLLFLRLGMDFKTAIFDAIYHAFTTYSTGGFSSHAASIGYYDDVWVEAATILFMLVGATSLPLMLALSRGRLGAVWKDPQWRLLMGSFLGATIVVISILMADGTSFWSALRGSAFSVATTLTGTGLATVDFSLWPAATHIILLMMMLMGGNAGSTSGGIKSFRFLVLGKVVLREMRKLIHPRGVIPLRVGGKLVSDSAISTATAFFFTYVSIWVIATVVVTAIDPALDLVSGASATASTLGNVGVGIGAVGPTGSYATLLPATKSILAILMWFGRLEVFTALLLFSPRAWKN